MKSAPVAVRSPLHQRRVLRRRALSAVLPQLLAADAFVAGFLIFFTILFPSPSDGAAGAPLTACGTVTTSVVLQNNLSVSGDNCLTVAADNITIDGNGHSITVSGPNTWAVYVSNHHHVTITNLISTGDVYLQGTSNFSAVTTSTLGGVTVAGADDVLIDHVSLGGFSSAGGSGNPALRTTFTNNTVTGDGSTLVDFMGSDVHPCPATQHVVTNNTLTSSYRCGAAGQPACNEPKVLFMRCGSGNTVTGNTVRSMGEAMPVRFRDEYDDSLVSYNTFWASSEVDGGFGAFNISTGNNDKHYPQNNVFSHNLVRADDDVAMWLQEGGLNNTFSFNTFWANSDSYVAFFGDAPNGNTYDHNTFYNAGTGEALNVSYRLNAHDSITNNIFAYGASRAYGYDGWATSRYQADYNLFFNRNGAVAFPPYAQSLAAWKTAVAPDDAHSIEGNPLFANTTAGDFSLLAGSSALGAASDGSAIGAWQPTTQPACVEDWLSTPCSEWSTCVNGIQTRTCTDAHACGTADHRPGLTQSCAVNPGPTLSMTTPTGKRVIGGKYLVQVKGSDANGVARINFFVDDVQFGTDIRAPFRATLDTRPFRNGNHTITIQAVDTLGNMSTLSRVVVFKNTLTIRLNTPWTKLRVLGTVELRPRLIYGGTNIVDVRYFLDKKPLTASAVDPYGVSWNTIGYKNGRHRLSIKVTDRLGKIATHTVYVTVRN